MPKKTKRINPPKTTLTKAEKAKSDFHFIMVVSVFAIVTIFAANMMSQQQINLRAQQQQALPVAQLEIAPTPIPSPTPLPSVKPYNLHSIN